MGHCAEQSAKCPEMCSPALSVAVEHHGTSVVLPPSPPASNAAESVHESYVTPRKVKGKTHVTFQEGEDEFEGPEEKEDSQPSKILL